MDTQSTRKIFIQRDFTYGTAVKFSTELPRELVGKVSEWQLVWCLSCIHPLGFLFLLLQVDAATFEGTIGTINSMFDSAEALSCRNISEGCLSCITGYTLHYCFKTNYEQVKVKVYRPNSMLA